MNGHEAEREKLAAFDLHLSRRRSISMVKVTRDVAIGIETYQLTRQGGMILLVHMV